MSRARRDPPNPVMAALEVTAAFYRRPVAWAALLVSSVLLTFGGGAVMFWFHAIFRGEQGPAIGDVHHWLLDSSLGFVALTPVLALILPLGVQVGGLSGPKRLRAYVATVAVLFTLTTGPGPFLHNVVAGAGTPLADLATDVFGHDRTVAARNMHVHDRDPLTEGVLQIVVGLPVYTFFTWLALRLVRGAVGRSRRTAGSRRRPPPPRPLARPALVAADPSPQEEGGRSA